MSRHDVTHVGPAEQFDTFRKYLVSPPLDTASLPAKTGGGQKLLGRFASSIKIPNWMNGKLWRGGGAALQHCSAVSACSGAAAPESIHQQDGWWPAVCSAAAPM